ncbi:MAG: tetracycline resistance MFS efflux pump [Candidatus Velthaea sp.]
MILRLLPILGITFIDILGFSILIPLMPFYVQRFGATPFVIGILFSTFALCQLVAGPVWGNVSDRIGRKAVLIISQIGATIGWTMLAFAPALWIVFLARIIEGFSGGNISVTQAYVADLVEPAKRARAFAYIGAAFSAGLIFGPSAGGWLAHRYGFAVPFLLAAGLQVITLVMTIFVLPESRTSGEDDAPATFADISASLRQPAVAPVLWQKLIYSLGLYGWFAAFTLVLQKQLGFTEETASYFFAGFGVASIVMQLGVVGRLTDAFGDRRTNNIGLVLMVLSFAIIPFMHDLVSATIMLVVFSMGLSINNATIAALIAHAAPENHRGTILGVGSSLESASGVIMPPISTGALGLYGVPATAAISAVFTLVALAMGLAQTRSKPLLREATPE